MRERSSSESDFNQNYFNALIEQQKVDDITFGFFYKPHTLTLLFSIVCGLIYLAFNRDNTTLEQDIWHGTWAVLFIFAVLSLLIMPNGPFTRPHPAVWRIIFGLSVFYFLIMVFTLFLCRDDARKILHWIDPKLKNMTLGDILSKEYAVSCHNYDPRVLWSYVDEFALAHFIGWLLKAILVRHYGILWLLSINWEITEMVFSHILPNFQECWWDAWILDVVLCNGFGIYCGMKLVQWLEMRNYHWESIRQIASTKGKIKRAVLQFTPNSWTPIRWLDPESSWMRVVALSILVALWQVVELNSFFLKHIFIVKPSHPLTNSRLALIILVSAPAIRQYYLYVTDPLVHRVGSQMWIFCAIVLTETVVCIKFGNEMFSNTHFRYIILWLVYLIFSSWFIVELCALIARKTQEWGAGRPAHSQSERIPSRGSVRRETENNNGGVEPRYTLRQRKVLAASCED